MLVKLGVISKFQFKSRKIGSTNCAGKFKLRGLDICIKKKEALVEIEEGEDHKKEHKLLCNDL